MPYTASNVPDHVPASKAAQWAAVWNKAHEECMGNDGDEKKCEEHAFKMANGMMSGNGMKEDAPAARTSILIEGVELLEGTLNTDKREVGVRLIRPGWSANKRYYSADVLKRAVKLYENVPTFADHPTPQDLKEGRNRSTLKLTGRVYDVRVADDGSLVGIRKVYDNPAGNAIWPAIVDAAENHLENIGMSHHAIGPTKSGKIEGQEGLIVEDLQKIWSVDDVIAPAAGGQYMRLLASAGDDLLNALLDSMTYDEWSTARPEFTESLRKQMKRGRQDDTVRAVTTERDHLQTELVEARRQMENLQAELASEKATHRADKERLELSVALERALHDAHLHPELESDIREQLSTAQPSEWPAILQREQRKARRWGQPVVPVQGAPRQEAVPVSLREQAEDPRPRDDEDVAAWQKRTGRK